MDECYVEDFGFKWSNPELFLQCVITKGHPIPTKKQTQVIFIGLAYQGQGQGCCV